VPVLPGLEDPRELVVVELPLDIPEELPLDIPEELPPRPLVEPVEPLVEPEPDEVLPLREPPP